jgi:hypothetical protein
MTYVVDTGMGFIDEIEADSFMVEGGILFFDNEEGDLIAAFTSWTSVKPKVIRGLNRAK